MKQMKNIKKETTIQDVIKVIGQWAKDHQHGKNDVQFVGTFCEFDEDSNITNDTIIAYGVKECIGISIKDLIEHISEEKEDFINI